MAEPGRMAWTAAQPATLDDFGFAVAALDADHRLIDCNRRFASALDREPEQLRHTRLDDWPGVSPATRLSPGDTRRYLLHDPGGAPAFYLQLHDAPADGGPSGVHHWALIESADTLAANVVDIYQVGLHPVLMIDLRGTVSLANPAAESLLGYPAGALAGTPVEALIPPASRDGHRALVEHFWQRPRARSMASSSRLTAQTRDGRPLPVQIGLLPFGQGENRSVLCTLFDLSERLAVERELVRQQTQIERLEVLNEELQAFSYSASHDLKSPIRTLTGLIELCQADLAAGRSETLEEVLPMMAQINQRQLRTIERLIALAGTGPAPDPVELRLCALIEQIWQTLSADDQHPVELQLAVAFETPIRVDQTALELVLQNLLENAIKYRDPERSGQRVKVSAHLDESAKALRLEVADNGIGMDPARLGEVFKPFVRLSGASEGTGLGLALVSKHLQQIGGQISLDSSPGAGTRANLQIPVEPGSTAVK